MRQQLHKFALAITCLVSLLGTADALGMYDPGSGRFMQRDPSGTSGFNAPSMRAGGVVSSQGSFVARDTNQMYPDGMNLYVAYHVMHGGVDPSGLERQVIAIEGFGTAIGVSEPWMSKSYWSSVFPSDGVVWNYYYWFQSDQAADYAIEAAKKKRQVFTGTATGSKTPTGKCVYDTVIVIGYSMGGDRVFDVVKKLQDNNVKVDLAITVDPVPSGLSVISEILLNPIPNSLRNGPGYRKPSNTTKWLNYYQHAGDPNGWPVSGAENVNLTTVYPSQPASQDILGLYPHVMAVEHARKDSKVSAATSAVPRFRDSWKAY